MATVIPKAALIVPTLNGGSLWAEWLQRFREQTVVPEHLLVIDSTSDDRTPELARDAGFQVVTIARHQFDHGGTRQLGVEMVQGAESIVFMTQDAVMASQTSLEYLLDEFRSEQVGAVYGRQFPRPSADPIEAHARLFNYPENSHCRSLADAPKFGIKTAFFSDSFSAYRRSALMQVGGFPDRLIFGEDTYVAARLLAAGWHLAYCANAGVYHSHAYSSFQHFRRYFDMGVFHAREQWICDLVGNANGEGLRFVESELKYLRSSAPLQIPRSLAYTAAKLLGYRLGLVEQLLPYWFKSYLSGSEAFWFMDRDRQLSARSGHGHAT